MKRLPIIAFCVFSFNIFTFAQLPLTYGVRTTMDLYETNKLVSGNGAGLLSGNEIEGSPYLDEEFKIGAIYTNQKLQYVEIQLRYNIYNDNLEFKTPSGEIQALATPDIVEKALIGNDEFVFSPFNNANKLKKGFLIAIEVGKASLYAKPVVVYKEMTQPAAYRQSEPAKFVRKSDEYYIRIGTEPAISVNSKKDLLSIFSDHQNDVEKYIDKHKIKISQSEGLKELVQYYNSL